MITKLAFHFEMAVHMERRGVIDLELSVFACGLVRGAFRVSRADALSSFCQSTSLILNTNTNSEILLHNKFK